MDNIGLVGIEFVIKAVDVGDPHPVIRIEDKGNGKYFEYPLAPLKFPARLEGRKAAEIDIFLEKCVDEMEDGVDNTVVMRWKGVDKKSDFHDPFITKE
jgi:hypothetical protein